MTKNEFQKIMRAIEPHNRWLRDTEKGESWHATRNQIWAHAERQIEKWVDTMPNKKLDKKNRKENA